MGVAAPRRVEQQRRVGGASACLDEGQKRAQCCTDFMLGTAGGQRVSKARLRVSGAAKRTREETIRVIEVVRVAERLAYSLVVPCGAKEKISSSSELRRDGRQEGGERTKQEAIPPTDRRTSRDDAICYSHIRQQLSTLEEGLDISRDGRDPTGVGGFGDGEEALQLGLVGVEGSDLGLIEYLIVVVVRSDGCRG